MIDPTLDSFLARHPQLAEPAQRWLAAAAEVRAAKREALPRGLPVADPDDETRRTASELAAAIGALERQVETPRPGSNHVRRALRRVAAALLARRVRSHAFAPARTTASPAARRRLFESLSAAEAAWRDLQSAAEKRHVRRIPWQLELAAQVEPGTPVAAMSITGHELPQTPAARRSWGERCFLSGLRFDTDGHAAPAIRYRSLEAFAHVLAPEEHKLVRRLRDVAGRAHRSCHGARASIAAFARTFPFVFEEFVEERWNPTFGKLGITDFPSLAVALNNMLRVYSARPLFGSRGRGGRFASLGVSDRAAIAAGDADSASGYVWETFGEVREAALALAHGFESLGIREGSRVGIVASENGREFHLADFAAVFCRAVSVAIHAGVGDEQLVAIVNGAAVAAMVVDRASLERVRALAARGELANVACAIVYGREGDEAGLGGAGAQTLRVVPPTLRVVPMASLLSEPIPPGWRSASGVALDTGVVFGDAPGWAAARAAGLSPDDEDELYTILFTSGSTGRPKGTPVARRRWAEEMCLDANLWPNVGVSFQSPATAADRAAVWRCLYNGGRVGFVRRGAAFFDDVRAVRPTILDAPPAVWNTIFHEVQRSISDPTLTPSAAAAVRRRFRRALGGRLAYAAVGGAASDPAVRSAMEKIFDVRMIDSYGTTETGNIAVGGFLLPGLDYRLLEVPEIERSPDPSRRRGELAVRTARSAARYLEDGRGPGDDFTDDGYFRTGDLVEIGEGGRCAILGRRKQMFKLSGSEFVSPEDLERRFRSSDLVEAVFVTASPIASSIVAVVVPASNDATEEELLAELRAIGRRERLRPGEIPRAVILASRTDAGLPWTVDNGLLTPSLKLDRRALAARYRTRIDEAYARSAEERSEEPSIEVRDLARLDDLVARLRAIAAALLSRPLKEVDPERSFVELGGDSLGGMEFALRVEQVFFAKESVAGIGGEGGFAEAPLHAIARAILARRVGHETSESSTDASALARTAAVPLVPVDAPAVDAAERDAALANADAAFEVGGSPLPPAAVERHLFLTGGTGFLGVHLLVELASTRAPGTRIFALVRAPNDESARVRLSRALADAQLPAIAVSTPGESPASGVVAIAGALDRDRFGLSPELYGRLAAEIGVVVHVAARVTAAARYGELRDDNVAGVRRALELATTRTLKAFHLVSSLNVALLLEQASGNRTFEETPLPEFLAPALVKSNLGYTISKWVGERMVENLARRAQGAWRASVSRPSLVTWAKATGFGNDDDWSSRVLASCLDLACAIGPDEAGVPGWAPETEVSARGLDLVPVDFAARAIGRLVDLTCSEELPPPTRPGEGGVATFHVSNLNPGEKGLVNSRRLMDLLVAAQLEESPSGEPMRYLPFAEWMLEAEIQGARAVKVLPQLRAMAPALQRVRSARAAAAIPASDCPPVDRELLLSFVRRHRRRDARGG